MTDLSIVIAIIGCIITVASFLIGRQTAVKDDGREMGSLFTDLNYIKESIVRIETKLNDDVKSLERRIDEQTKVLSSVNEIAVRAEKKAQSSHRRLDAHFGRTQSAYKRNMKEIR